MNSPVNISGILVHARPERALEVAATLRVLPGVEVRAVLEHGRIIVVAEEEVGCVGDTLMAASICSGVITAALVYQHEVADPDETITVNSSAPPSASDTLCTKESQP